MVTEMHNQTTRRLLPKRFPDTELSLTVPCHQVIAHIDHMTQSIVHLLCAQVLSVDRIKMEGKSLL